MKLLVLLITAAMAAIAQQKSAAAPAKVATGAYECWANGAPRLLLNFSIRSATEYRDTDNKPGTYAYDSKTGRIIFKGGGLDGVMPRNFYAMYHEPKGHPTVSFRNPEGREASYCERTK
ncbi:MAG TPA: hypothetical protein VGP79_04715 [Bryobacteraceae bacterium]|nr:hypothetical protein [Bryobacteraceae bacterium]